jgi:hypothetical protein
MNKQYASINTIRASETEFNTAETMYYHKQQIFIGFHFGSLWTKNKALEIILVDRRSLSEDIEFGVTC